MTDRYYRERNREQPKNHSCRDRKIGKGSNFLINHLNLLFKDLSILAIILLSKGNRLILFVLNIKICLSMANL